MDLKNHIIILAAFLFILIVHSLSGIESWILPINDPLYRRSEEFFLNNWMVPPFEDTPVVVEEIREGIKKSMSKESPKKVSQGQSLLNELKQPIYPISPIVELGFRAYAGNEQGLAHFIDIPGQKTMLDYMPLYELYQIPPLLKLGFLASSHGFSLLFAPEFREGLESYLFETGYTNVPNGLFKLDFYNVDTNIPYRGAISIFKAPLEIRIGREKLQLGPGRISSLSANKQMPYYDYLKARFFVGWFSFSWYLLRLNPIMETAESEELENLGQAGNPLNPEVNARVETPFSDKTKHLAVHKLLFTPFPWLSFGVAELSMIGGRSPQLSDINPLTLFHNNYSEGNTNQTMSVTLNIVPYAGILLYGEYFLYEKVLETEIQNGYKPNARAMQFGLTVLSEPFINTGPGRIRLDGEISIVDPWCYERWYDLKKYTSRIVYVHANGRYWVDFPLGFYLGPDAVQYLINLSYGVPGKWEIICSWIRWGKGSVDLYGWGPNYWPTGQSMYPTEDDGSLGLLLTDPPTTYGGKAVYWTDSLNLYAEYFPIRRLRIAAWFNYKWVRNRYNIPGNHNQYWQIGTNLIWDLF